MKQSKKVGWLHMALSLFFLLTIFYVLPRNKVFIFAVQYILAMLFFSFLSHRQGFVLLIAYILMSAMAHLIRAWMYQWETAIQLEVIWQHMVMILNLAMLYAFVYLIKELEKDNKNLKKQVDQLMQYIGPSKVLTKQEFEERKNLLAKAMERRGERGYEIYFSLEKVNFRVREAVFEKLTALAMETFRHEYDLVGKWDDISFVVLLQNTDENGMKAAMDRYFSKIHQSMHLKEEEISMDVKAIGEGKGQAVVP
ncbi:hypothetical protein [Thermotalea metallivorans]|uniref:Uncharacterized protein n=1 Tax=Thermotalea metallivorans TaxID=520762 RepID=A0A140L4J7_9FIRM|nr:hypothetical protein [Thermotalea metallivorans]KXG75472.1 hypothetical protein AN619_17360 [Thermotalea metallivorans]